MPYQYVFPVLARQVLVCGFDHDIVEDVRLRAKHDVCCLLRPVDDGLGTLQAIEVGRIDSE